MLTIDANGQFISGETPLGIVAKKSRGRWQYRDIDSGKLYASGMDPARFAEKFWLRTDFASDA